MRVRGAVGRWRSSTAIAESPPPPSAHPPAPAAPAPARPVSRMVVVGTTTTTTVGFEVR